MKAARKAAREAAFAAQQEIARRARANTEDLTVFFSARRRAEAVDGWLDERVAALQEQAEARRAEQLRQCGAALGAMRRRGETVREIARMAQLGEKTVREMIRAAEAAAAAAGDGAESAADGGSVNGSAGRRGGVGVGQASAGAQGDAAAQPAV